MNQVSDAKVTELIKIATQARQNAYAPYSGYKVGAAILAKSGQVYLGCNIEKVTYSTTTHAETLALDTAVKAGEREFVALALVTDDSKAPFPCGQCLQDLTEFDLGTGNLEIIAANLEGVVKKSRLRLLLPERFGPANLGIDVREY